MGFNSAFKGLIVTVFFVVNSCETVLKNTMLNVRTYVTFALTEPHMLCWDANLRFKFRYNCSRKEPLLTFCDPSADVGYENT
jgi:hypothetical protein